MRGAKPDRVIARGTPHSPLISHTLFTPKPSKGNMCVITSEPITQRPSRQLWAELLRRKHQAPVPTAFELREVEPAVPEG